MNQYPLWKYALIFAVVTVGVLYSLPNLYGEDPALQISGTRSARVDAAAQSKVEETLKQAGLPLKSASLEGTALLVRFADTDIQLKAQDAVKAGLGENYIVALNLAPRTPRWLFKLNALPMYLGLDLRGGVHFLMEVDMDAALTQAQERYVSDIRTLLRDKKLRYVTIARGAQGVEMKFRSSDERDRAREAVHDNFRSLLLKEQDSADNFYLFADLSETEVRDERKFALQQNITTLRNRINELGVAEPVIQQQGASRVVVQLPGVQDTARAKEIIGATATLEFRLVDETHSVAEAVAGQMPAGAKLYKVRGGGDTLLKNQVMLTGDSIIDAASGIDQQSGGPAVFITLDGKGAAMMSNATRDNVGKQMAVVFIESKSETRTVDGQPVKIKGVKEEVINQAVIKDRLSKRFQITGLDSTEEARDLALLLRAGALKAPVEIVEERTVGPSMGKENIEKGFNSTLIGFAAIAVFMAIYYHFFGILASVALSVNIILLLAVMSMLQATLTLPGIAGIALTVGMAIDANVLIFERIREELRNGNSPQASIAAGYERAFDTILDSNITTLIAGFALFLLGSGPVRGFAVTLCIGILTSMSLWSICGCAMVNLLYGRRKLAKLPI
ncbi:MAG: protein translocase subunit SecD [Gammaproteobacteria bacterium]|nr:protein translocase subunit SecD [Gammaproteobacteria bacterium]